MQRRPADPGMKKLDFIIIGAQKAGTTALFRYLRRHPRIYMPLEKEIPFFSDDVLYARGWEQFARRYYGHAPPDRLWGKATPRYMIHPDCPSRIRATMPDTRLIALLRDPIERCISH